MTHPLVDKAQALLHEAETDQDALMTLATGALDRLSKLDYGFGYALKHSWNSPLTSESWH